jgi:hypothetical protein
MQNVGLYVHCYYLLADNQYLSMFSLSNYTNYA